MWKNIIRVVLIPVWLGVCFLLFRGLAYLISDSPLHIALYDAVSFDTYNVVIHAVSIFALLFSIGAGIAGVATIIKLTSSKTSSTLRAPYGTHGQNGAHMGSFLGRMGRMGHHSS